MSSLLVFNRVYRLEIQSVMLVFSTGFVKHCLSNLLHGQLSPPPPLPCVNKYVYTVHTYVYSVYGGSMGSQKRRRPQTNKHLPPSTCTGQFLRKADIKGLVSLYIFGLCLLLSALLINDAGPGLCGDSRLYQLLRLGRPSGISSSLPNLKSSVFVRLALFVDFKAKSDKTWSKRLFYVFIQGTWQ